MARYNTIFAGPVSEPLPQVQERTCAATILPGTALVESGSAFAQAGASTNAKVYIAAENFLCLKGVDTVWAIGESIVGYELLDEQLFNARVPTSTNVARGAALTTNSSGKFVLATTTGQRIIAFAEEAYNNTSGADQLVRVRKAQSNLAVA